MAQKVAKTTLSAGAKDVINTVRANAPAEYQAKVPIVRADGDIPKVGQVFAQFPALANTFLDALVNRIILVRAKSATFNNLYADLKKGYLEYGDTIEDVFVELAKAVEFSAAKGETREFKRTIPDVKAKFHVVNWKAMYPITVEREELCEAFLNSSGVENLIAKIIDSVVVAAEYDEFLLFKYMIIKAVANSEIKQVKFNANDITSAAKKFRGISNLMEFIKTDYNKEEVHTNTKKEDQYIFMDAMFNAEYDVDVLAAAFNMDKAMFSGHLKLIDDFTTFDNDRFDVIAEASGNIEEVTAEELAAMANVKAIIFDEEWFQVYDKLSMMTEKFVASGLYWNYFYHQWKIVSSSPFSNAVAFVASESNSNEDYTVEPENP